MDAPTPLAGEWVDQALANYWPVKNPFGRKGSLPSNSEGVGGRRPPLDHMGTIFARKCDEKFSKLPF